MSGKESGRNLIILAEDIEIQRSIFIQVLKRLGYKDIRAFEHGELALEHIRGLSEIDLNRAILITDFLMPTMDGLKLTGTLKKEGFVLPVMLHSSTLDSHNVDMLNRYINKGSIQLNHFQLKSEDLESGIRQTVENFNAKMVAQQTPDSSAVQNTVTLSTQGTNDLPEP